MPAVLRGDSLGAIWEGERHYREGKTLADNPYAASKCRSNQRHWFTDRHSQPTDHCMRCGAPAQTAKQRRLQRYWRQGWQQEQKRERMTARSGWSGSGISSSRRPSAGSST